LQITIFEKMSETLKKISEVISLREKKIYLILAILSFILMFLESIGIAILIPYLNIILNGNIKIEFIDQLLKDLDENETLIYSTVFLILFFVIKNIFIFGFNYFQLKFGVMLNKRLASDLLYKFLNMPYKVYFKRNSSTMIREITSTCSDFSSLVISSIMIINDLLIILGISILIILLNGFGFFLILIIFLFICSSTYFFFKNKFKTWGEKRHFHSGENLKYLMQSLSSPKDLRIYGRQNFFLNTFNDSNKKIIHFNFLRDLSMTLPRNIFEVLGIIFLTIFLIKEISINDFEKVIISVSVLMVSFIKILPAISRLIIQLSALKNGQKAVSDLHKDMKIEIEDLQNNDENLKFENDISFEKINFKFDKEYIIKNFSLKIKKGEKIFLYGKSGSGKSTLINLLMGLIKPDEGKILIDNKNIFSNLRSLRQKIGYVPQEFLMLDDTIKKNIAFGLSDNKINNQKLNNAIDRASLRQFIDSLPNKENQKIGEKGVTISVGQKQRIAIARALYGDPKLLILDEATSNIDTSTEREIINEVITKNVSGLTLIVISHNLNLKNLFDRSVELNSTQ
tara:strand:- start:873 stop:2579 length:1707 start_codon:yes stop_codon:yes gene_type:complete